MRAGAPRRISSPPRIAVGLLALGVAALGCGGGGATATDGAGDAGAGEQPGPAADAAQHATARTCVALPAEGRGDDQIDPALQQQVSGSNGTFEDACDEAGNLVEQHCEVSMRCTAGPKPTCEGVQTGKVVSKVFDCGGRCVDGACAARCPQVDDGVDFRAADGAGAVTLQNRTDRRVYECTLARDDETDTFDCRTGAAAGLTALITAAQLQSAFCTGGRIGTLTLMVGLPDGASVAGCAYVCTLPPGT